MDFSRSRASLLLAAVILVPVAVYHASYRGFFADDDLGSINWARAIPLKSYLTDLPALDYPCRHSRPTGYFYYGALWRAAGFHYAPWAIVLLLLGIANVALLWMLLRKLGLADVDAALGCLCFACSRAIFDAWWQPMFIYDVLCTLFALAMLLAYSHRRWVLSFIALWLAIRSKEIGIVLPAILLAYELTIGERNWKRVFPFFIPAAIYGAYGLHYNLSLPHISYSLTVADLSKAAVFYASKLAGIRYLAFALPLLLLVRDRRVYFALAAIALGLGVYLLLPGRMLNVYVYLALTGVAIAVAVLASRYRRIVAVAALAWIAWQIALDRKQARIALAEAEERHVFMDLIRQAPDAPIYTYADAPGSFGYRGGEYAIRETHAPDAVYRLDSPDLPAGREVELLRFDWKTRRLEALSIRFDRYSLLARPSQLDPWQADWPAARDGYREVRATQEVRMYQPAAAREFMVEACGLARSSLSIAFDATHFPDILFPDAQCTTRVEPLPSGAGKVVSIFLASQTGVKVGTFGFR